MISVIVLAYNAERSIARCLDSIVKQTFKDFELIIIDDGSSDATLDIIRSYERLDKRIVVISRNNLGVAKSRQEGIDISRGKYSIFVDADDWVEPNFLESLYGCVHTSNSDIAICDMLVEYADRTEYLCQQPKDYDSQNVLGQMLEKLHGSLCNKLIAKSAYLRTGVRFLPGLNCCEDQYVVMALLSRNIIVAYCNQALYHYDKTINNNSITNNWLDFEVCKKVEFIKSIEPFICTEYQYQCFCNYIGRTAYTAVASSKNACPNYRELFDEYLPQIKQSNIPILKKIICYLRMKGIKLPIRIVKRIRRYYRNRKNTIKNG